MKKTGDWGGKRREKGRKGRTEQPKTREEVGKEGLLTLNQLRVKKIRRRGLKNAYQRGAEERRKVKKSEGKEKSEEEVVNTLKMENLVG